MNLKDPGQDLQGPEEVIVQGHIDLNLQDPEEVIVQDRIDLNPDQDQLAQTWKLMNRRLQKAIKVVLKDRGIVQKKKIARKNQE